VVDRDGKPRIILDTEVNVVGRSSGRLRLFDEDGTAVVTLSDYLRGEPSLMVGTTMLRVFISGKVSTRRNPRSSVTPVTLTNTCEI